MSALRFGDSLINIDRLLAARPMPDTETDKGRIDLVFDTGQEFSVFGEDGKAFLAAFSKTAPSPGNE